MGWKAKLGKIKILKELNHTRKYILKGIYNTLYSTSELKVNVGGGMVLLPGFKTLDYPNGYYSNIKDFYVDYKHNLASYKKLPFKDGEVSAIYTMHTLEHIPLQYWEHIFNEFHRVLRPGGKLRIVCPDYDKQKYPLSKYDPKHPENHVVAVTYALLERCCCVNGFTYRSGEPEKHDVKDRYTSIYIDAWKPEGKKICN